MPGLATGVGITRRPGGPWGALMPTWERTVLALGPKLSGFWRFGEARGTFANLGAAGGVATPQTSLSSTGGVTYLQTGAKLPRDNNKAVWLPGTNNTQITVPNNAAYNGSAFVFHCIIRPDDVTVTRVPFEKHFGNAWRILVTTSKQVRVDAKGGTVGITFSSYTLQAGRHYALMLVYDGTTLWAFLEGRSIGSGVIDLVNTYAGYTNFAFGTTGAAAWKGIIDEAWFYNGLPSTDPTTYPTFALAFYQALSLPGVEASSLQRLKPLAAPTDALHHMLLSDDYNWFSWCQRYGVKGGVGELGWVNGTQTYTNPNGESSSVDRALWDALHEARLSFYDRAEIDCDYWSASHRRNQYLDLIAMSGGTLSSLNTQAAVYGAHPTTTRYVRGLNLSSPILGGIPGPSTGGVSTSAYGNNNPGTLDMTAGTPGRYGTTGTYSYDNLLSIQNIVSLMAGAIGEIRILGALERWFPTLGGTIDANNVTAFTSFATDCRANGLPVLWLFRGSGQYWLWNGSTHVARNMGSAEFTVAHYQDALTKFAAQYAAHAGVHCIELISEPGTVVWDTADKWEPIAQTLVTTLRTAPTPWLKEIRLSLGNYSRLDFASSWHPRPFVDDPWGTSHYTVHGYGDKNRTGTVDDDYEQARLAAVEAGY